MTRVMETNHVSLGVEKSTADMDTEINQTVKQRFYKFMVSKLEHVEVNLLNSYLEKLMKIVKVGDLEIVLITLIVEQLVWKESVNKQEGIDFQTELKLYQKSNLKKVYYAYFGKDNTKVTPLDIFTFYQLFHVFIYSAVPFSHD